MSGGLLWLIPAPLLLLLLAWPCRRWRPGLLRLAPWAPLPALALALWVPGELELRLPWLLLGAQWQLDAINRPLLALSAGLWWLAGLYARHYPALARNAERFWLFWLLTLGGNLGLLISRDIAGFYAGFTLMTFAGYGLVIHEGHAAARRAGRVYLSMAVLGEGLILAGLLLAARDLAQPLMPGLAAAVADSPWRHWIVPLLLAGFGVKAGLPLLHVWLPLAHPVAPTPASAVLSGAMIKAGLLGWILTLPLGVVALSPGHGLVLLGLLAAFGAAGIGVLQREPKVVLAYSSVSQMGLITVLVGLGLLLPQAWPLLLPAALFYALHHGLAKGALFLGVGVSPRGAGWLVLAWPALSLAGMPLSSGAAAKGAMKDALEAAALPALWSGLPYLLSLAAVGTTLLMARFLWLLWHGPAPASARSSEPAATPAARGARAAWLALVLLGACGWWWLPGRPALDMAALGAPSLWWPLLAGVGLAGLAWRWPQRIPRVPPGDLLALATPLVQACRYGWHELAARLPGYRRGLVTPCIDAVVAWWRALLRGGAAAERLCSGDIALAFLLLALLLAVGLLAW